MLVDLNLRCRGVGTRNQLSEASQVAAGENPLERVTDISQGHENVGVGYKTRRRHTPIQNKSVQI